MKRIFLLTALFCSLLTAGAQTDNVRRSKPQTPAKAQTTPARKPAPAKTAPAKTSKPAPAKSASSTLSPPSGSYGGHDYVDLGLPSGTLWATCNVGASEPTEYGDYFTWGETKVKNSYNWSTCLDTNDFGSRFRKYNNDGGKTELDIDDDAAYVNWGSGWRMPSLAQQDELRTRCTWTWTSKNGVSGYIVKSKYNGCSLFLPAAGYYKAESLNKAGSIGCYWSRSLSSDFSRAAYLVGFYSAEVCKNFDNRFYGQSIRPVRQN